MIYNLFDKRLKSETSNDNGDCLKFNIKINIKVNKRELSRTSAMKTHMTTQYLHSIIDENEELRLRVSKLEEIQKYMEALLKRCE